METNALAVISTKSKAKPPLKKSEIIEALALRKLQHIEEEQRKAKAAHRAAEDKFAELVAKLLKSSGTWGTSATPHYMYASHGDGKILQAVSINVSSNDLTPEIKRAFDAVETTKKALIWRLPKLHEIKRQLRYQMAGQADVAPADRVKRLLNEGAKLLDKTLAELEKKSVPIAA